MFPNLIVIGAMKSGTTSLHYYLSLHPEIFMSKTKELDFFVAEGNWDKGLGWYESHLADAGANNAKKVYGESSTNYTKYPSVQGVPARMHSIIPDAKLIYIIRNPVERIISHYLHNYIKGVENRPISEVLLNFEKNHYVDDSRYYFQLEQYLKHYSKDNILIIISEELKNNRKDTLEKVFRFLDVDDKFFTLDFTKEILKTAERRRRNIVGKLLSIILGRESFRSFLPLSVVKAYTIVSSNRIDRPTLDGKLKEELIAYLKNDIDQLREHTGNNLECWHL